VPARDLNVICLDTPSGEVVEVSSSCNLSVFSLKTNAQFTEDGGNTPEGSLSVSIGELWAEMDVMDEISHGGNSAGNVSRNAHHERRSLPLVEKTGERASCTDKGALLNDTPGPSNTQPRGRGRCSAKNKVVQILSAAPELFLHVYEGHLLIASIHLRPVWI
jgi:hypothetical protein